MTLGSGLLALLAGSLSTLSPCVLPLLPIVVGTAVSQHRLGPVSLAAGLALSFVAIGLFIATIGFSIGLDGEVFRNFTAALLLAAGVVLAWPALQARFISAIGPVGAWAQNQFGGFEATGLRGQFALGLLLGAVWSPCVGPTLGAASVLAAQGKDLAEVAFVMTAFGLGSALPLLLLGMLSREATQRWRSRLLHAGKGGKGALGIVLAAIGLLILSGLDRALEAFLVNLSPAWLTELTTRF